MTSYHLRPAELRDCYALARNLRDADRLEVAGLGLTPASALRSCYRSAILRRTAIVEGEIAAMWGMNGTLLGDVGYPFMLTAPVIERVRVAFFKEARKGVAEMLRIKTTLMGHVAADYVQACRFLEALGFEIDLPLPVGPRGALYRRFHLPRAGHEARQQQQRILRPGAAFAPFIVYTAGRSRTVWLSAFLTYGKSRCHNEVAITLRNMHEACDMFATHGTGTAETAVAPAWRLIQHFVPGIKSVVVKRPAEEIIASFARSEVAGIATIDEDRLRRIIHYENRCLDKIAAQPGVLTVDFKTLHDPRVCAAIFEHCLPYQFDWMWWHAMKDRNIQADIPGIFRYYQANRETVENFKIMAKREMIALVRGGQMKSAG